MHSLNCIIHLLICHYQTAVLLVFYYLRGHRKTELVPKRKGKAGSMPTQRRVLFLHFRPYPGQARQVAAVGHPSVGTEAPGPWGCFWLQIQAAGSQVCACVFWDQHSPLQQHGEHGTFTQRQQDGEFCLLAEASSPEGDEGSAPLQLLSEHLIDN